MYNKIMFQEEFNKLVGENLAKYRKFNNYTQIALAEKINYSDKAVSKWEKGECLPDVYVLKQLADLYGVTVNDLISPNKKPKVSVSKTKGVFNPLLSCCIVWIVAIFTFFILSAFVKTFDKAWLSYIVAIPCSAIVILVFACIYKHRIVQLLSISTIIWTVILALHLSFVEIFSEITMLYYIGIPVQALFILWFIYRYIVRRKQKNK
jgi:transcriptional regulator with XRE-family HTH domain